MHWTKSYYHGFFKYGAISKSHPCEADVLDVQLHVKQSNFMTSSMENVNKLCLFVQETEHLQVKLTMIVCPERAYEMFTTSQMSVHSDSGSMSWQEEHWYVISSCRPEPGKQNLLVSAICFNFYWKLRFI